ncbi:hypothetical protein [Hyphomicrobium sp.]|uniref:hypothetical protein n=1 Tax=Hyphomicrobium sp. TaxID=82 RepID=UPI001DC1AFC3|nr:hypothetical protein [Hyphomicrobium sp.]MBY0560030.1 hypothetical protein [Hyphomicrobium sp.]
MTEAAKVPMMLGTSGKADYLAFAKKGNIALGIKPESALPGESMRVPNTVWFGARLRAAPGWGLFSGKEGADNVVSFQKTYAKPGDAFPNVTWEKSDNDRASTTIGILLPGSSRTVEDAILRNRRPDRGTPRTARCRPRRVRPGRWYPAALDLHGARSQLWPG